MTRRLLPSALVAALLVLPTGVATAQDAGEPEGTVTTQGVTSPPAEQADARLGLSTRGIRHDLGRRWVVAGQRFTARARLAPFVAGERITIRVFRDGRLVDERTQEVERFDPTVDAGAVQLAVRSSKPGRLRIEAVHRSSRAQEGASAGPVNVEVLPRRRPTPGFAMRVFQARFLELGYPASRSGRYDGATARAVMAYRKVNGMARTYRLTTGIYQAVLSGRGAFVPKYPRAGRHVEADISRQVLALVDPGGRVYRVFHTSSGAPATPTVRGTYRFYRKHFGTNAIGMVHSSFFIRGYAIHGYKSVPTYNASHGCLRVPIPSAKFIYDWIPLGMRISVYD